MTDFATSVPHIEKRTIAAVFTVFDKAAEEISDPTAHYLCEGLTAWSLLGRNVVLWQSDRNVGSH
jgi:hypothetical protein